jgi:hypothetical protein
VFEDRRRRKKTMRVLIHDQRRDKTLPFDVARTDTVRSLKEKVLQTQGIPIELQQIQLLSSGGIFSPLQDEHTLSHYPRIQEDSIIVLTTRPFERKHEGKGVAVEIADGFRALSHNTLRRLFAVFFSSFPYPRSLTSDESLLCSAMCLVAHRVCIGWTLLHDIH